MKKVFIFILLVVLVGGAILLWRYKRAEKMVEDYREGTLLYLDSGVAIDVFDLVYVEHTYQNYGEEISIEELITKFNEKILSGDNYLYATLNSNNTITIDNIDHDNTFDCSIEKNNCKYKIVCLEKETQEFDLGGC